ncbi:TPA: hypothetical protein ACIVON_002706 [Salmonella enterica subsp. enterica serovar Poona]|nr:hypothetical protein [Salmonella enterica]EKB5040435.1 hypothetical protein [Salmonella enterica]EME1064900.1 hypothetical protein [Salmonella enterica]HEC9416439.1 hypothetical protein [Salmonella enterica subsp. enterica serovar Poona]
MTTITRERAQEIFLGNGPEPTASEQRELARIALASLTAKPIAHTSQYGIDRMIRDNAGLLVQAHGGNAYEIPLYTTPPAPIVPDAISTRQAISKMEECEPCDSINVAYKYGWNACRATMLQANQRDLSQPVDPQVADYEKTMLQAGWVMVPKTVTPEISLAINKVGQHCTCGNCSQRLWNMLLAAAPKPETGSCTK